MRPSTAGIRATRMRHLPAGMLSRGFAWAFVAAAAVLFFLAAAALNPLCLRLARWPWPSSSSIRSPSVSLFLAPGIGLLAGHRTGRGVDRGARLPGPADSVAHCRRHLLDRRLRRHLLLSDFDFDRAEGLFSLPRVLGLAKALYAARALHLLMIVCLLALVRTLDLGALALAGVASIAALLIYEHSW